MSTGRKSRVDEIQALVGEDGQVDKARALELAQRGVISWSEYVRLLDYAPAPTLEKGLSLDVTFGQIGSDSSTFTRGSRVEFSFPGVTVIGVIQSASIIEDAKSSGARYQTAIVITEIRKA